MALSSTPCISGWQQRETEAQLLNGLPHSLNPDTRRRIAVNLRLTEPGPIAKAPIAHFDGLDTFDDLPRDGKCVADYWF